MGPCRSHGTLPPPALSASRIRFSWTPPVVPGPPTQQSPRPGGADHAGGPVEPVPYLYPVAEVLYDKVDSWLGEAAEGLGEQEHLVLVDFGSTAST